MSYILDALKKAEAERERGQVPGLHAAAATPKPDEPFEGHRLPSWAWAALGALMTLVAALVWVLVERDPPAAAPLSSPAIASVESPANSTLTHASPPPSVSELGAKPDVHDPSPRQADLTSPGSTPNLPMQNSPANAKASAQLRDKGDNNKPSTSPARAMNNQRIYALNELPDDIRQGIPTLSFGGAMYSDQPASRMLLINGQAFHEGDRITDQLTLREIKLRSAVLVFKGHAYAVNY